MVAAAVVASGCGGEDDAPPPRVDVPAPGSVPLGVALSAERLDDAEQRALVERAFASVTPENELKAAIVQPERGEWSFGAADRIVDFARGAGMRVRGHTLVWHQQVPGWLAEEDWSPEELREVLAEHIRTVAGRYRGRIDTWDVVNEPFTDRGDWRTSDGSPWLEVLGPQYVEIALRAARDADPDARLFVNELGAELGGPKLDALVRLARSLRERGVPLDGIGLEAHLTTERPPSRARLERTLRRLAALDLDVEITELDVVAGGDERRQARVYRAAAAACAAVRRCTRLTVWGLSDRDGWLGADAAALPFDERLAPKPAWRALLGGLRR